MKRVSFGCVTIAVVLLGARTAFARCPSYTPDETATTSHCGVNPSAGHNPTTSEWAIAFEQIGTGAFDGGLATESLPKGCGKPEAPTRVAARFPCTLLKAVAMLESGWTQFCVPDAPAASVGSAERTLVSFDCGYGAAQVTSGMHVGENPNFDRERIATDAPYNLFVGSRFLRDKWENTRCVGDRNPDVVEDWYAALWAYNGLSYQNNPNNPKLSPARGPYNPRNGGAYTYPERVFGWAEHPPSSAHWSAVALAYPDRAKIGASASPPELDEPSCASPTDCVHTRSTHRDTCTQTGNSAPDPPPNAGSAAERGAADAGRRDDGPTGIAASTDGAYEGNCSCRAAGSRHDPQANWGIAAAAILIYVRRSKRRSAI